LEFGQQCIELVSPPDAQDQLARLGIQPFAAQRVIVDLQVEAEGTQLLQIVMLHDELVQPR
jgi:hypothetical protein